MPVSLSHLAPMPSFVTETVGRGVKTRVILEEHGGHDDSRTLLTFGEVMRLLRAEPEFGARWVEHLGSVGATKSHMFFWECVPVTKETLDTRPFECIQLEAPSFARMRPDSAAFAEHHSQLACTSAASSIAVFGNLGGDSVLVSPAKLGSTPETSYAHLGAFTAGAPREQQIALWQNVADQVLQRADHAPLWLSTSGLGVIWLHVRLDRRPKYYTHGPYRTF